MNPSKLFGICIVFLLAIAIANADQARNDTMLDSLLSGYDMGYDDGNFNVNFLNSSYVNGSTSGESGSNNFSFHITSPNTNTYTVLADLSVHGNENCVIGSDEYSSSYLSKGDPVELNTSGTSKNITLGYDGSYYICGWWTESPTDCMNSQDNKLTVDLRIYQDGALHYQKEFDISDKCKTIPVVLVDSSSNTIKSRNISADPKDDLLNLTLRLELAETKSYTIGAYIWDNKSATAYAETTIVSTGPAAYSVPIIFNSTLLKDFKLNNEPILLKAYSVNGRLFDATVNAESNGAATPGYNHNGIDFVNSRISATHFSTSQFETQEIAITNVLFNTSKISNGKITELGVLLNVTQATGNYNVTLSLGNQYEEMIETKNQTISSSTTIWFNGTDIYESKINGPYNVGFINIMKSGKQMIYLLNATTSIELNYNNFTAPPMSDLNINNSDVKTDGTDVNITIFNNGTGDAAGITVSLFDDNADKKGEIILSNVSAGNRIMYQFKSVNLPSGFVVLDFENSIEELNESNNIASITTSSVGNNTAPSISSSPSNNATRGKEYNYTMTATDADSDPITYSVNDSSFSPLSCNSTPCIFRWNITENDYGTRNVKFTANDSTHTVPQSVTILFVEDIYLLKAKTYDNSNASSDIFSPIDSEITINSETKNTTGNNSADFNISSDIKYSINHSATGYQPNTDDVYFDSRLTSCINGQNCTLPGIPTTICLWETTCSAGGGICNNWYCSVEGGTLPQKTWFRYDRNTTSIKRANYLTR